jgi:hypothetical protein
LCRLLFIFPLFDKRSVTQSCVIYNAVLTFRINLIDKSSLHGDTFSYSGDSLVWKARLFLFVGFALIAGGLAGSVVSGTPIQMLTSAVFKHTVNHHSLASVFSS